MADLFKDLEIVLEAKKPGKKVIKIDASKDSDATDYNDETPEDEPEENEDADNQDDDSPDDSGEDGQDYTEEEQDIDPEDNQDEDDATDYSDEEGGDEDSGDDADNTDEDPDGDGGEDGPNDYTSEDDGSGDDGSDTEDESSEETPEEAPEENDNRRLLSDYTNFFYLNKGIVERLSTVSKSDILMNKIINQVKSNLAELQKQLYDFIVYQFPKNKYVKNLYNYNYFIEAFRINVEMLKKISILSSNE